MSKILKLSYEDFYLLLYLVLAQGTQSVLHATILTTYCVFAWEKKDVALLLVAIKTNVGVLLKLHTILRFRLVLVIADVCYRVANLENSAVI